MTGSADFSWTEEVTAQATSLWMAGHSAAQVAMQIGCPSRSAVIGKIHRLGLSGRTRVQTSTGAKPSASAKRKPARQAPSKPRVIEPVGPVLALNVSTELPSVPLPAPAEPLEAVEAVCGAPAAILALRLGDCRWPIGDPGAPSFRFCCASTRPGRSYCAGHEALASSRPVAA